MTVQEEGYHAALECNEMTLLQTQLKVEPCISAPAKTRKKGACAGAANGSQHNESAPKASSATLQGCSCCHRLQTKGYLPSLGLQARLLCPR